MNRADVILVGAGLSALSAAQLFRRAGLVATVLEKSRGVGGRASTRRIEGVPVDFGAQFFTARSELFQQQVEFWKSKGTCFEWSQGFHRIEHGAIQSPADSHPRYACAGGMTALSKEMSEGLLIERQCRVMEITREENGFRVTGEDGRIFWGKRLVLSAPAPQILEFAAPILPESWRITLGRIRYAPCFAVMAEFSGVDPEWKGLYPGGDELDWVGADFTKRTPRPTARYAVLHSTPDFAVRHFENDRDQVGQQLIRAAAQSGGEALQGLILRDVHRWKFARVEAPFPPGHFLAEGGLCVVGDCFGGTIESAWLSGRSAALHLLNSI